MGSVQFFERSEDVREGSICSALMKLIFGNRRNSSSSFCRTYRTAQGPWRCREGLLRGPTGGHARAQQATALAQQMRAPLGKRGVVALSKAASIPFPVLLGAILMCTT